jgi:FlgN protein
MNEIPENLAGEFLSFLLERHTNALHLLDLLAEQQEALRARDVENVMLTAGQIQVLLHEEQTGAIQMEHLMSQLGQYLGHPASGLSEIVAAAPGPFEFLIDSAGESLNSTLNAAARKNQFNQALIGQELSFYRRLTTHFTPGGYHAHGGRQTFTGNRLVVEV